MELKSFQIEASEQIAERYESYMNDPLYIRKNEIVPFYQNLSAITGAGKTLVLADAIEQIRAMTTTQPVVLWLTKGKVVVGQTFENLSNGKYADNIPSYAIKPLLDCKGRDILDDSKGLILVATVGKFNQKDKELNNILSDIKNINSIIEREYINKYFKKTIWKKIKTLIKQ